MNNPHAAKMDAMYRRQRYIYDLSRKYFLFGRDTLLARLPVDSGARVVEIGCGTARNLVILGSRHPQARFYGVDISSEMLISARANIRRRRLENVSVAVSSAETLNHQTLFGLETPFDIAFFSYSLSMIPDWRAALSAALANIRPGGCLAVVDFWDQKELPMWFEKLLGAWVRRFDVTPRPEILDELAAYRDRGAGKLTVESVGGRYAFIALFETAGSNSIGVAHPF
ncbi:MAG: class I SAM-dependent methyltransferase [Chloracidobacterium sp.]|nr:class I SAM-dependent methyltransferase [Chloracidobacterium validum]